MKTSNISKQPIDYTTQAAQTQSTYFTNITKKAIKGAAFLATAPIIGMLPEKRKFQIYKGNEKKVKWAHYLSFPTHVFSAIELTQRTGIYDALASINPTDGDLGLAAINVAVATRFTFRFNYLINPTTKSTPEYNGALLPCAIDYGIVRPITSLIKNKLEKKIGGNEQ